MTLTTLEFVFVLLMLGVCAFCSGLDRGEVRTRVALAQCSAEVETLAGVCEGRR